MKENEKYYWTDIESGITFECSKEYRETMLKIWESVKPKIQNKNFGNLIITGTGGEIDRNEDKNTFYE